MEKNFTVIADAIIDLSNEVMISVLEESSRSGNEITVIPITKLPSRPPSPSSSSISSFTNQESELYDPISQNNQEQTRSQFEKFFRVAKKLIPILNGSPASEGGPLKKLKDIILAGKNKAKQYALSPEAIDERTISREAGAYYDRLIEGINEALNTIPRKVSLDTLDDEIPNPIYDEIKKIQNSELSSAPFLGLGNFFKEKHCQAIYT